jgi:hypothetical protein
MHLSSLRWQSRLVSVRRRRRHAVLVAQFNACYVLCTGVARALGSLLSEGRHAVLRRLWPIASVPVESPLRVSPWLAPPTTLKPSPSEQRRDSRAAKLGGGLWRATGTVGKTGRLSVEWGTTVTVEHRDTEWGACAGHARLQLNDNGELKINGRGPGLSCSLGFSSSRTEISVVKSGGVLEVYWKLQGASSG